MQCKGKEAYELISLNDLDYLPSTISKKNSLTPITIYAIKNVFDFLELEERFNLISTERRVRTGCLASLKDTKFNLIDLKIIIKDDNNIKTVKKALKKLNLNNLNLRINFLIDDDLKALASVDEDSKKNPETYPVSLDLTGNRFTDIGISILVESEFIKNLTILILESNYLCENSGISIGNSIHLQNLTTLNLNYNKIKNLGFSALVNSKFLSNINSLEVIDTGIDNKSIKELCESRFITKITNLDLRENSLSNQACFLMANSTNLSKLKCIDVVNIRKINFEGLTHLVKSNFLKHLQFLLCDIRRLNCEERDKLKNLKCDILLEKFQKEYD